MRKLILALMAIACLEMAGCMPMQARQVQIISAFDAEKVRELIHRKGNNTVKGSAMIRQRGGGVVTCAGQEVRLFPATEYANERIFAIYGNTERGAAPLHSLYVDFYPDIAEYKILLHNKLCDPQGYFTFDNIPDGDYFVSTVITWIVGNAPQGGALMQRVRVNDDETVDITLAP